MRRILFAIIPVLVPLIVVSYAFSQNRPGQGFKKSILLTGNQDLSSQSSGSSVVKTVVKTVGQNNSVSVGTQAYAYSIYDCWWGDSIDMGLDGYTQSRVLYVDVEVDDSGQSVSLNVYMKAASSLVWVLYTTTPNFDNSGSKRKSFFLPIGSSLQLNRDSYDFIIDVCEAGGTTSMVSRGPTDDADLKGQHFETAAEDRAGCPYSIEDCSWQILDLNTDGYTDYRDLRIDVRRASIGNNYPHTIYLVIYMQTWKEFHYEQIRYATQEYVASDPQNTFYVRIGGENWDISRGAYDIWVDLYVSGISVPVQSYGPENDTNFKDQLFETSIPNGVEDAVAFPQAFHLDQNYPNPFNPSTTIEFQIQKSGYVSLKVYDLLGKEVKTLINKEMKSGHHQCTFDGSGLTSGIYLYRLQSNGLIQSKKFVLLK